VIVLSLLLVGVADATNGVEISRLGGPNAFARPLQTGSDLQQMLGELRADLQLVLSRAECQVSVEELAAAVARGQVTEIDVAAGTTMQWMALRRDGVPVVEGPLTWAGKQPFAAFAIELESSSVRYTFLVPKPCGNLALLEAVKELTISVTSGEITLTDADGRPISIRPGKSGTLTVPHSGTVDTEIGEIGRPTTVEVTEGTVEVETAGHPLTMVLESGYQATTMRTEGGQVALDIPDENPGPVPIRIGEITGTAARGTSAAVAWPEEAESPPPAPPSCALSSSAVSVCVSETVTLDAGGSSDEAGQLAGVGLQLDGPARQRDLGRRAVSNGMTWTFSSDEPGDYTFAAVAETNDGRRSDACTVAVEVRACPPLCALSLSAEELVVGQSLVVDASASRAAVGELARVVVEVSPDDGDQLSSFELSNSMVATREQTAAGSFTYRAVAVDELGQHSSNTCEAQLLVRPKTRFGLLASLLAGGEQRWRDDLGRLESSTLIGGKLGLAVPLDSFDLVISIGGVHAEDDRVDSSLFADLEAVWKLSRGSLSAGIGVWDVSHSDSRAADLLLGAAIDLPFQLHSRPLQLVVEGRLMLDEIDHLDDSWALLGGLRLPLR
jgi:hypothetical protein